MCRRPRVLTGCLYSGVGVTVRCASWPAQPAALEHYGGPCVSARGFTLPYAAAVSPDGRHVYFGTDDGMAAFRRQANGALRQLPGSFGCNDWAGFEGCLEIGLTPSDTWSVAITPDGRHVYMGSSGIIEMFLRVP